MVAVTRGVVFYTLFAAVVIGSAYRRLYYPTTTTTTTSAASGEPAGSQNLETDTTVLETPLAYAVPCSNSYLPRVESCHPRYCARAVIDNFVPSEVVTLLKGIATKGTADSSALAGGPVILVSGSQVCNA